MADLVLSSTQLISVSYVQVGGVGASVLAGQQPDELEAAPGQLAPAAQRIEAVLGPAPGQRR